MKTLQFTGENSHEYLTYGTHLVVRPTAQYSQGELRKDERIRLVNLATGQRGGAKVLGYVTGVTVDKFDKYSDLIELGPSHLKTPEALIENLYDEYPDLPMDEWTFIAFRTYLIEVVELIEVIE